MDNTGYTSGKNQILVVVSYMINFRYVYACQCGFITSTHKL